MRITTLDKRIGIGVLNAAGAACVCVVVWGRLVEGAYDGLLRRLIAPPLEACLLGLLVISLGALLGIWLPRMVAQRRPRSAFLVGAVLGLEIGLIGSALWMWPDINYAISRHMAISGGTSIHHNLWCCLSLNGICILWLGIWAWVSNRRATCQDRR